ncbi:MAG: sulfatase [Opitutales bacterium]
MKKLISLSVIISLSALSLFASDRPSQPNVILILADDLGYQDLNCFDLDDEKIYETPFLDSLAKKGVMFTQAYSPAPTCAPSRSAIMSGLHPARTNLVHVSGGGVPVPISKRNLNISPYYTGRSSTSENTLAKTLRNNGYITGHVGKWHMGDHAEMLAFKYGFDYTFNDVGVTKSMGDRNANFATTSPDDPYQLDENGYPKDQTNLNAIEFLNIATKSDKAFFLYYATFLVHAPIHSRSEALLKKYCDKLNMPYPLKPEDLYGKDTRGQKNPYYCAMIEMLDYYCANLYKYLQETDDPRWKGHKLHENTYIIFSSDNGGMEGLSAERFTDNFPLQRGKISAMEGGIRVPLFVVGKDIPTNTKSDVLVNGLDLYPTIMSLTNSKIPENKRFDGIDLSNLLRQNPSDASLVKDKDGKIRDTMLWHFPIGVAQESAIRIGDYKLVKNYYQTPELELFKLYDSDKKENADIGEAKNLADEMPEKTKQMHAKLMQMLGDFDAKLPHKNPYTTEKVEGKDTVMSVVSHELNGNTAEFVVKENGAKLARADLLYKLDNCAYEENWKCIHNLEVKDGKIAIELPENTTHYFLNLVDENDFLVTYPSYWQGKATKAGEKDFNETALKTPKAKEITKLKKRLTRPKNAITIENYKEFENK